MYLYLARIGLEDSPWFDPAIAGGIFLGTLLAALVFHKLLFRLILRLSHWAPTDLASRMLRSTRWPATIGILGLGATWPSRCRWSLVKGSNPPPTKDLRCWE